MVGGELFIFNVYLAGLLSFFSPCIFPLLPVYLGMLSKGGKRSVFKTILFVIGLSTSFVILGFGAGGIGQFLLSDKFRIASGIVVVLFGIIQLDLFTIPFLQKTKLVEINRAEGTIFEAFLLGFSFSLGWTPCVGPILASILFISSGGGNPLYGALTMAIYVLGLATPFVVLAFSSDRILKKVNGIKKYLHILKKIGGILLIIMGILLITNNLQLLA